MLLRAAAHTVLVTFAGRQLHLIQQFFAIPTAEAVFVVVADREEGFFGTRHAGRGHVRTGAVAGPLESREALVAAVSVMLILMRLTVCRLGS